MYQVHIGPDEIDYKKVRLEVKINRIYMDVPGGMCYFTFFTSDKRVNKVRGPMGVVRGRYVKDRVIPGTLCYLDGYFHNGILYVTRLMFDMDREEDVVDIVAKGMKGRGIGPARARFIFRTVAANPDKNRDEIIEIISKELPEIHPVFISRALDLMNVRDADQTAFEEYLFHYGVGVEVTNKIFERFGVNALEKIKTNPYQGIKDGLPLWLAEYLGYMAGIDVYAEERISGLIHYVMKESVNCGYTMCPWQMFYDAIDYYSGRYRYREPDIPEIITTSIACNDKDFCWDENGISFRSLYGIEKKISEEVEILKNVSSDIEVSEYSIEATERHIGVKYSESQKKAFSLIENSGVSILTGGPGTGKTTVVKGLIERFKASRKGAKVALCAPTGKAAKRLSEATGMRAQTIHKLIDYRPFSDDLVTYKSRTDPIDADLIVMDEGSMVDTRLFYLFLQAVRPGTTVIVCGDEDQLPSVGPGNVLHDLIASGEFAFCRLTENFRQKGNGSIVDNAKKILHGKDPVAHKDFHLIKCLDDKNAYDTVMALAKKYYDVNDPYSLQILGPSYKGDAGIDAINEGIREMLGFTDGRRISEGDKVMFIHTSYKYHYVNGQMGVVSFYDGNKVIVSTDGDELELPASCLEDLVPAYSMTIHKAQGSEADRVVICLSEAQPMMLQRSLLYTAVTRAKKEVWIVYVDDALKIAIRQNSARFRPTRLGTLLKKASEKLMSFRRPPALAPVPALA